jgi:hypothetical protein
MIRGTARRGGTPETRSGDAHATRCARERDINLDRSRLMSYSPATNDANCSEVPLNTFRSSGVDVPSS